MDRSAAHRIYVICARELRDDFDYIGENGSPWNALKFPTVSSERRTGKFLSGPASLRNIREFMPARRSKRYDFRSGVDSRPHGCRSHRRRKPAYLSIVRWGDAKLTLAQVKRRLWVEKWLLLLTATGGIGFLTVMLAAMPYCG